MKPNYDLDPLIDVRTSGGSAWRGWDALAEELKRGAARLGPGATIAVDCYSGLHEAEVLASLTRLLAPTRVVRTADAMLSSERIRALVDRELTDDPVFGRLSLLELEELFDPERLRAARAMPADPTGFTLVFGPGAALLAPDERCLLVYADMPRWELQLRFRRGEVENLGLHNRGERPSLQYKRGFFVDWRVLDRHKRRTMARWDYLLDTTLRDDPRLARGDAVRAGLRETASRPFRVVPFFDPAPWGGQWMKERLGLDPTPANYGWCFDCVPEENSLKLRIDGVVLELPSINLVFAHPRELLGDPVHARFGDEFPIRFDFLDTWGGGNLSLQVHPLTEYIQRAFGMHYTQDESYYMLDAQPGARVYLGLREGVDRAAMARDLALAQEDASKPFPADRYAASWPAAKHDHFLIPGGTVHCSGAGAMVLEISATPYIFTFKLWDWSRLGLDGRPRPIHLQHGLANIQWDRVEPWTRANLVSRIEPVAEGPGWREERTGLHRREFIETRRHWFTGPVAHHTGGGVNVLNLIEGEAAVIESPDGAFHPFEVHYAETFIVPAAVGPYTIRPATRGSAQLGTLKASVRF